MDNKLQIILAEHDIGNTNIDETLSRIEDLIKQHDDHLLAAVLGSLPEKLVIEENWRVLRPELVDNYETHNDLLDQCRQVVERAFKDETKEGK